MGIAILEATRIRIINLTWVRSQAAAPDDLAESSQARDMRVIAIFPTPAGLLQTQ